MNDDKKGRGSQNPIGDFICLLSLLTKIIAIKGGEVLTERKRKDEERPTKN